MNGTYFWSEFPALHVPSLLTLFMQSLFLPKAVLCLYVSSQVTPIS